MCTTSNDKFDREWIEEAEKKNKGHVIKRRSRNPGRALIHVFNNPSATEGYLSWGYLSRKLEFFTPYQYR